MNKEEMKHRTKEFAKQIIILSRNLPNSREGRLLGDQLFRAGTSVASDYRAAAELDLSQNSFRKWALLKKKLIKHYFGLR